MSNVVLDAEQGKTLKDVEEIISAAHSRFHCPGCCDQDCLGSDMSTKHCCVSCVLDVEIENEIRARRSPEANG
jgi:hypothetical protein